MLSIPGGKVPRKVAIKIARAESLRESMKDGKKKVCKKFKVTVLGGKKKESSNIETGSNGNVQWSFNCVIKLHKVQSEPIVLLVEDSDGNHKGQVIIPIVKIPPKPHTFSPNQDAATSNNILCSELEPTNKSSEASGFLLYWIWIEEYYMDEQGDSGKKSFNKSMSSLFGSKSRLSTSKSNVEIKNPDSISNYGSVMTLNKPEKHKKSSSFLKLKIGKKKAKPSLSDAKITPDSSDVDSISNFSFNQGNPFENDNGESRKHDSLHGMEMYNNLPGNPTITVKNCQNDPTQSYRSEILSYSSHESYPEYQPNLNPLNPVDNLNNSNNILPVQIPAYNPEKNGTENVLSHKQQNSSTSNVSKYKTLNVQDLSSHKDVKDKYNSVSSKPQTEFDIPYHPGHFRSGIGSDYSVFSDKNDQPPLSAVNKTFNEESENIKKENSELRAQNKKCNQQINDLQSELDSVKTVLCKLRTKLLEDGVTKYLEIKN